MCTLIVLHRCVAGFPVVVAANRDEFLHRAAEGPRLRDTGSGPIAAPLDRQAGGTWLGLNAGGLFVGITNRPTPEVDRSRRSRGHVVLDALAARSAEEAAGMAGRLPASAYNPFNLVLADRGRLFAVVYDDRPSVRELGAGAHVVGNADPDDLAVPKIRRLHERAAAAAELAEDELVPALAAICRGHEGLGSAREDACIHAAGYGTRSSTLLRLRDGPGGEMWYADGPPCSHPYEDFTPLLHELGRTAASDAGDAAARTTR